MNPPAPPPEQMIKAVEPALMIDSGTDAPLLEPQRVISYLFDHDVTMVVVRTDGQGAWVGTVGEDANIWWLLVAYWPELLTAGLALVCLWMFVRMWRRRRAGYVVGDPYCRKCRYSLRGGATGTCPECGASLAGRGIWVPRKRGVLMLALRTLMIASVLFMVALMTIDRSSSADLLKRYTQVNEWFYWPSTTLGRWLESPNIYGYHLSASIHYCEFNETSGLHPLSGRVLAWGGVPQWHGSDSEYATITMGDHIYRLRLSDNTLHGVTQIRFDVNDYLGPATPDGRYLALYNATGVRLLDTASGQYLPLPANLASPGPMMRHSGKIPACSLLALERESAAAFRLFIEVDDPDHWEDYVREVLWNSATNEMRVIAERTDFREIPLSNLEHVVSPLSYNSYGTLHPPPVPFSLARPRLGLTRGEGLAAIYEGHWYEVDPEANEAIRSHIPDYPTNVLPVEGTPQVFSIHWAMGDVRRWNEATGQWLTLANVPEADVLAIADDGHTLIVAARAGAKLDVAFFDLRKVEGLANAGAER